MLVRRQLKKFLVVVPIEKKTRFFAFAILVLYKAEANVTLRKNRKITILALTPTLNLTQILTLPQTLKLILSQIQTLTQTLMIIKQKKSK